jgi:hypothetical protein
MFEKCEVIKPEVTDDKIVDDSASGREFDSCEHFRKFPHDYRRSMLVQSTSLVHFPFTVMSEERMI